MNLKRHSNHQLNRHIKNQSMSLTRSQLRPDNLNPANEKQAHINLMRAQNDKMKAELKLLTEKLEQFVEKSR